MIEAARLAAAAVVALAGSAEAEIRMAESWVAMVNGCMVYAETGARDRAFGVWRVAADGGGLCTGVAGCEDDAMTFVAPGELAAGEITVKVGAADWAATEQSGESRVADFPRHMSCESAVDTGHTPEAILALHAPLVAQAVETGRLVEAGVFAGVLSGPYLGCGHDGRPYQIEFSLKDGGAAMLRLYHPAREGGAEGLTPACTGVVS